MPAQYDNSNKGALFNNADRKKEPSHPDHAGNLNVVCPACGTAQDYWLNAWIKTAKETGRKFFSLQVKPKQTRSEQS